MVLLVPYDGSPLAGEALETAAKYSDFLDDNVIVLTVIPNDADYARDRGWIAPGEPFDAEVIATAMENRATDIAPTARFLSRTTDSSEPTATSTTNVVREIRNCAGEVNASVVFIGSENAGSIVAPLSSVGGPVASDHRYDIYIVRHSTSE